MKVVLDTNVLVSATFWSGPSFRIMQLVDESKLELILSKNILKEYDFVVRSNEILEKITTMQQLAIAGAIQKILLKAKIIEPKIKLNVVKADPDDNIVLEAAVEGGADFIVSQDKHLTDLVAYGNIKILKPIEFLKSLEGEK
ncbi:MAG: putative toxin-antitoxin system toxin component, PIN family [DPANN group archaeon]|nr:putative toxin-antitoxin system toxin component, PIN family [DPANN group archaeon]